MNKGRAVGGGYAARRLSYTLEKTKEDVGRAVPFGQQLAAGAEECRRRRVAALAPAYPDRGAALSIAFRERFAEPAPQARRKDLLPRPAAGRLRELRDELSEATHVTAGLLPPECGAGTGAEFLIQNNGERNAKGHPRIIFLRIGDKAHSGTAKLKLRENRDSRAQCLGVRHPASVIEGGHGNSFTIRPHRKISRTVQNHG